MKISVKVVANARSPKVVKENDTIKVWIDAPAVEGKANRRLVKILSEYYNKPASSFIIKSGHKSRKKVIEIL
ncbi:MAG: DUF167 domain-containing protein [Candidatus Ratteibacteria bacterium]|nr:DUF167 domain-containing protein [Candidatus Ratteibacteria bacterium]